MTRIIVAGAAAAAAAATPLAAWACATCGCSLSSDIQAGYSTGYSTGSGWQVSLLDSYIDQSQLRTGSHAVSPAQVAAINDAGGSQEVERQTVNNYVTLGVGYSPNMNWNFNLQLPYIDRYHTTYGNATTDQLAPSDVSKASLDDIGDAKLIASYQGLLPTHNLGVQLGVKLPTGNYGGQNTATGATVGRHPVFFSTGPNGALGQALDTALQPGTGSTDIIVGAYYAQAVSQDFDAFVNGQFEVAVQEQLTGLNQNFRPGNLGNLSTGMRYMHSATWTPQVQVDISHKSPDQGALADDFDTAGTVVYLTPGVTVAVTPAARIYGFVQVPVASWLEGYQMFPRWTGNLGISYAF